jgi:hypothetical protein
VRVVTLSNYLGQSRSRGKMFHLGYCPCSICFYPCGAVQLFLVKSVKKLGKDRSYLIRIKTMYDKAIANIVKNWEKIEILPVRSGMRQMYLLCPF